MHGLAGIRAINAWAASEECKRIVASASAEVKYEGHRPDGDPVQKHSAGPLYPFVFYRKGDSDYIMVGDTAVRVQSYATAEQLVAEARANKAQNVADVTLEDALRRVATINGMQWGPFRVAA